MAVFANISILDDDLRKAKVDYLRYVNDDVSTGDIISLVKQEVYGELKAKCKEDYPSYDNSELDTLLEDVKDLPNEKNLTRRIATLCIAKLLEYNELYDQAAIYRQLAMQIPFTYYLDEGDDDIVGSTEVQTRQSVRIGR